MKKFKTSLYLRLSKEDEKVGESESIVNQKILLKNFIKSNEDLELVSIKIDDGYSGSNFERPAFKELMEDVRNKEINCIVVKDFSRFGRDFIEVGKYLEEIFPFMNVRFISVNDNYDSFKSKDLTDNLIIPFKNLLNDTYLRDISLKVRSSIYAKIDKGEYIGAFATYGYLKTKDENNKNVLIVDEEASKVVKDIFKYRLNGLSASKIAIKLNEQGILSPMEYKNSIGLKFNTSFRKNNRGKWTSQTIFRILGNPVYIGTLEQKKYLKPNYKIKKTIIVPKDDRVIIENNHEPIIDKDVFYTVQNLMLRDTRVAPNKEKVYLLSGIAICGECGSNLIRKNNGTKDKPYIYYVCSNSKNKKGCIGANISQDKLEKIIFEVIKNQIDNVIQIENIIDGVKDASYLSQKIEKINKFITNKEKELIKYKSIKLKLYEDLKEDILTQKDYEEFNILYTKKIELIEKEITKYRNELNDISKNPKDEKIWINSFKKYKSINSLNRELVVSLINEIKVYNNKNIEVHFKYDDEYKKVLSYLKELNSLQVACNG